MWYDASVAAGSGVRKDHKMARTARIKKSNNGTARYHLMSRTNDRRFLFEKGSIFGDRPRESPISQRFRGIGPAVTPRSGLLAVLLPVGDL